MKRWIGALFLLLLCVSCGKEIPQEESGRYRIGVSLPHTDSVYRSAMKSLAEQEYQDSDRVELILMDGEGSQKKQNENLRDLIDGGVDALVLVPTTLSGPVPMVRYANEREIPVVVVDDSLDMTQGISVVSLVTSDNETIGYMAADLLIQGLKENYPKRAGLERRRADGATQVFQRDQPDRGKEKGLGRDFPVESGGKL